MFFPNNLHIFNILDMIAAKFQSLKNKLEVADRNFVWNELQQRVAISPMSYRTDSPLAIGVASKLNENNFST